APVTPQLYREMQGRQHFIEKLAKPAASAPILGKKRQQPRAITLSEVRALYREHCQPDERSERPDQVHPIVVAGTQGVDQEDFQSRRNCRLRFEGNSVHDRRAPASTTRRGQPRNQIRHNRTDSLTISPPTTARRCPVAAPASAAGTAMARAIHP